MPTATPGWFDASYYAQQRIEQMNLTKLNGKTDWNQASYEAELARLNRTPYEDFEVVNSAQSLQSTNISPNPLFNVQEYLTALANYANATNYSYAGYPAGKWTAQKAMEHMFNDYHVSAWDHFTLAGQFDLINPSNNFDIKSYYQSLTDFRNEYVNPDTGALGWEGRTDWTVREVAKDNIWAEINPVEGLYGEAVQAGIKPVRVPVADQVTPETSWNPWVPITPAPDTPPSKPVTPQPPSSGGSNGGGSNGGDTTPENPDKPSNPDNPSNPDKPNNPGKPENPGNPEPAPWQPDETIAVGNDGAGQIYTGKNGENTLFEAKDGLNASSVIDGGKNSENVLKVNLSESFEGFSDRPASTGQKPGVTNVQTVSLDNTNGGELSFNGKNMAGVQTWNIENGPVNLEELENADVTVNLENIHGGDSGVNIGFADTALETGDKSLELGLNNVQTMITAPGIEDLTVNTAKNSQNNVDLEFHNAKSVMLDAKGAADDLSVIVDNAEKVELRAEGRVSLNIDALNSECSGSFISQKENSIVAQAKTVRLDGGAGRDYFTVAVRDKAVITGNGGSDAFSIRAVDPRLANASQAQMIDVTLNGQISDARETFSIDTNAVEHAMRVVINGYDASDSLNIDPGWSYWGTADAFVSMTENDARTQMRRFFADANIADLTPIMRENSVAGFFNAKTETAYAFATNTLNEVTTGVQINDIENLDAAKEALLNAWQDAGGWNEYECGTIELEREKTAYSVATYPNGALLSTIFQATVGQGEESTLIAGDKIIGTSGIASQLKVEVFGGFNGLDTGAMQAVQDLMLYNHTNASQTFNAEQMEGIHLVGIYNAPMSITNLSIEKYLTLWLDHITQPDAEIDLRLLPKDAASDIRLNVNLLSDIGSADSLVSLRANDIGKLWFVQSGHSHVDAYLDISNITGVKEIEFAGSSGFSNQLDLDLTTKSFRLQETGKEATFTITENGLHEAYDFGFSQYAKTVNIIGKGQIGMSSADAAPSFNAWWTDLINFTAQENVYANITTNAHLQAALSGAENTLKFDVASANIQGSSGNDEIFAEIRQNSSINGGGGQDYFSVQADIGQDYLSVGEDGIRDKVIEVQLIGKDSDAVETFCINTTGRAAMRVNIDGFDGTDALKVNTSSDGQAYSGFTAITSDTAKTELATFFDIDSIEGLTAISESDGSTYGYYNNASQTAYGFASDSSGNIKAGVQLNGVSLELATQAFVQNEAAADITA